MWHHPAFPINFPQCWKMERTGHDGRDGGLQQASSLLQPLKCPWPTTGKIPQGSRPASSKKVGFWSPSILEILMVHHQRNKYLFWVQFCLSCPQSLSRYDYLKADHVWPASRKSHTMWSAQGTPFREKDGAGGLKIMGFTDHMTCYTLRMQLTRKALERQWKAHLPRQLGCGAMIWDAA